MDQNLKNVLNKYIDEVKKIYDFHLKEIILYGSYARGDYSEQSDIDIMLLLDLSDMEIKEYRHKLSDITFDINMDYDLDIKPIAKNIEHFNKWVGVYAFYSNINSEGVKLYAA